MIEAFIFLIFVDGSHVTLRHDDTFNTMEECTALASVDAPIIAQIAEAVAVDYRCIAPGVAA